MRMLFRIISAITLVVAMTLPAMATTSESSQQVRIGVLAHKGQEICKSSWQPTMDYLSSHISGYSFTLIPMTFDEIDTLVRTASVEFIIVNPSIYIEMEVKYYVSRIATMENLSFSGKGHTVFGGVIFTRADRSDINSIKDLRGKKFMGVDKTSLGGWHMAWGELKKHGIAPKDFASLEFLNNHRDVVYAVKKGVVDAATVRTDTLERMAAKQEIDIREFKVIPYKGTGPGYKNFPFLLSTPLYPEWPIAKVRHTPDTLAKLVASALLELPKNSPAAKAAKIEGWTIPLNYESVDNLLKELRISPYEDYGKVTWRDILRQHWKTIAGIAIFIILVVFFSLYIFRLNIRLNATQLNLNRELIERKKAEEKLADSYEQLEDANNQIMDSIHYASNIQRSIMPHLNGLSAHMDDYFVIWRPRDIIGGDIYCFNGQHNNFMLAIIDCTGHGVPGAIMTMLAGSTLSRVVNERGYTDPSAILNNMNKLVREMLSGEGGGGLHDNGLDIGICYVDKQAMSMTFAGAKISLFCVSRATVKEIRGDRHSIGYQTSDPDYVFTSHKLDTNSAMSFYMMTDGISDQIGGEQGLPFGKKRFKELIVRHSTRPFKEQQALLLEAFELYRGQQQQRDDITVIGFRV
ncbi:MAG: PhnD/SsuA/transferrin family substrate-binding protein [Candidatus Magnetobacterium sp. LHC-1]|nr:PhnD/SsuA/transferrin family substrate-binding protein [Nitrospirota bacterium]